MCKYVVLIIAFSIIFGLGYPGEVKALEREEPSKACADGNQNEKDSPLVHAFDGKKKHHIFLSAHNNRFLMNLMDLNWSDPENLKLIQDPKLLKGYIEGVKEMNGANLGEMQKNLPQLLDFLKKNQGSIKWLGVEASPRNFPLVRKSIATARLVRVNMEIKLSEADVPNKKKEIENFIMGAFGLDVYLAVYHPDLIKDIKMEPLESDEVLDRINPLLTQYQKEFLGIRKEQCASPESLSVEGMCDVYRGLLKKIIGDAVPVSEGDISQAFGDFPYSELKERMKNALIGAVKWVRLQHERDVAVAQSISQLEGTGFAIYGKNHIQVMPALKKICETRAAGSPVVVPPAVRRKSAVP